MTTDADSDTILSTTHHTWLVGPWEGAGDGAVHVRQLDDEDSVVMILRPGEAAQVAQALLDASERRP